MAPETNNPCSWADWRVVSWSVIKRPKTNKKRTRACSRLLLHSLIDTPAGKLLNPGPIFHAPLQSQPSFVFQRRKSRRAAAAAAGAWASNFPEARSKPKVPTITFYARKNFHHNKKKPDPSPSFTGTVGGGPGFIVGEERERSLGSQGGAGTGEKVNLCQSQASRETDTHGIGEGGVNEAFSGLLWCLGIVHICTSNENLAARPFAIPPSHSLKCLLLFDTLVPPVWNAYNPQQKATCMMDLKFLFTRSCERRQRKQEKKKGGTGCTTKTSPILANRTAGSGLTAGRERSAQNSVARLV
ncbi:hypothetical protein CCM_00558 [Cordyceps militaris CM01]|uniref:Uncharacterized protein n=1 Tax=Cordyceps militaris (strain CM01) TaxID=983644 RepID=G3J4T7_CORMM|nr:uncharacterized protein CCM_00558 [Cordyceps militaris CM01]EGX95904.1 hypothetical protein CCM_00558 [Cordyceps militaris CM01]